jgi:hypothetical protein
MARANVVHEFSRQQLLINPTITSRMESHLGWIAICMIICLTSRCAGQRQFKPILPPSYPLAVKNPYLSGKMSPRLSDGTNMVQRGFLATRQKISLRQYHSSGMAKSSPGPSWLESMVKRTASLACLNL